MFHRKQPNQEPIPGYRLIELLGQGGCGEVWKCVAPGGLFKAIKFVYGDPDELGGDRLAVEELRAIEFIKTIRHPFLLSMDRVEHNNGELMIVTELADNNLHDDLLHRLRFGEMGLPRATLLNYLREAAEVLDLLNIRHGLQHLDIKPRNLFLVSNHIKVGDFGLVSSLGVGKSTAVNLQQGAITPLYASPELFQGNVSKHCDQYSLAITFQELLTGSLPFQGRNSRQLLMMHTSREPDLSPLPAEDQPIIARALSKDPDQRFPSCMDLIEALAASAQNSTRVETSIPSYSTPAGIDLSQRKSSQQGRDTHRDLALTSHTATKVANNEVAGKYRQIRCISTSPIMEVWEVESEPGQMSLLKILYTSTNRDGGDQTDTVMRLRSLEHPVLNTVEIVEDKRGKLVMISKVIETNLRTHLQKSQNRGLRGIPRFELLDLLRPLAVGLDYLYRQHSIQHLNLNPRNLLVDEGRLLVDEYGLGQLLWMPTGQFNASGKKRYLAPELFHNQISPSCDQYSLALIYLEMVTGHLPRTTQYQGRSGLIDLSTAPPQDRDILAKALDIDPRKRWPSCSDMIAALEMGQGESSGDVEGDEFTSLVKSAVPASGERAMPINPESIVNLKQLLFDLVAKAGGASASIGEDQPVEIDADGRWLRYKFAAGVPLGTARLKLDQIRDHLYGQTTLDQDNQYGFLISLPSNFWQQWTGRLQGLEVGVELARQHALAATPIEVSVQIVPIGCSKKRGQELLRDMGISVLEQLRNSMLINAEKRVQDRLLWPHPLEVAPILEDGSVGDSVLCRGKDLSLSGVGFYLPHQLETSDVYIHLPATDQTHSVSLPARLVRAKRCGDDWYEVGALFRLAGSKVSAAEICLK